MKTVFWWFVFTAIAMIAVVLAWLFMGYTTALFGLFLFAMTTSVMSQWVFETFENPIEKFERNLPCDCLICRTLEWSKKL
jgi:Flp pilus assembly protein TadB